MRMNTVFLVLLAATLSSAALAQVQADRQSVQAGGQAEAKGTIDIKAKQKNTTAVAVGLGNTAKNTAGSIKGKSQIQGNVKLNASQSGSTAVAIGIKSKTANESGVIGGD